MSKIRPQLEILKLLLVTKSRSFLQLVLNWRFDLRVPGSTTRLGA